MFASRTHAHLRGREQMRARFSAAFPACRCRRSRRRTPCAGTARTARRCSTSTGTRRNACSAAEHRLSAVRHVAGDPSGPAPCSRCRRDPRRAAGTWDRCTVFSESLRHRGSRLLSTLTLDPPTSEGRPAPSGSGDVSTFWKQQARRLSFGLDDSGGRWPGSGICQWKRPSGDLARQTTSANTTAIETGSA
jgi:hypothetical protein